MSEAHESHLHLLVCIDRLNGAWRTLKLVEANPKSPLLGPAFRYALVEYATAFTNSEGALSKRRKLPKSVVPTEFFDLHNRIINARQSVHAHADLKVLDAELHVSHINGEKHVSMIQNHITGLEELSHLGKIVAMVEAVLDSLYALHKSSQIAIA